MTDAFPSPPAQSVWWDPEATLASVMSTLRLHAATDVDRPRLETVCLPAAGAHINDYLDRVEPLEAPSLPTLQAALERLTIELYHGIVEDPVGLIEAQLLPQRERFGLA